jgi:hypothetical protein
MERKLKHDSYGTAFATVPKYVLAQFLRYPTFLFRSFLLPKFKNSSARQDTTLVVEERREWVGASPERRGSPSSNKDVLQIWKRSYSQWRRSCCKKVKETCCGSTFQTVRRMPGGSMYGWCGVGTQPKR